MNIGYFFNDPEEAQKAALSMYNRMNRYPEEGDPKYNTRAGIVTYFGNKHLFYTIKSMKDIQMISGITFDGIFIKANFEDDIDRYILSRFRPRCHCNA